MTEHNQQNWVVLAAKKKMREVFGEATTVQANVISGSAIIIITPANLKWTKTLEEELKKIADCGTGCFMGEEKMHVGHSSDGTRVTEIRLVGDKDDAIKIYGNLAKINPTDIKLGGQDQQSTVC